MGKRTATNSHSDIDSSGVVLLLALHPQIVYRGAVFPLGFDVVDAAHSTAQHHGKDHGQDLHQEDGHQAAQHLVAVLLHQVQDLLRTALEGRNVGMREGKERRRTVLYLRRMRKRRTMLYVTG